MININLIAERRARKQRETNIVRMSTLGVALVVFAMLALNLAWWKLNIDNVAYKNDRHKDLLSARADLESFLELKKEVEDDQKIADLLDRVRLSEGAWLIILSDLSRAIPNDVVLTSLATATDDDRINIRLSGRAKDQKAISAFMTRLPEMTRLADGSGGWAETPKLEGTALAENKELGITQMSFEIVIPIDGLYGGEL
jgi:Tfp pilus assembly protein PilN